ncbi:MAG: MtnX-like HAD-IB family phosphatase [Candidatus Obscuribacterales bacterium]|nr:MtnX-like HAD-IB family phosphatase [Candidatus Obscuribacterales bacterium]
MKGRLSIYCDFDGTITTRDSVDFLLEHVAGEGWKQLEEKWERGEIGSRECMAQQVRLFEGGWAAMEKALAGIVVDPTFKNFALWCEENCIDLHVVSDGIDRTIDFIMAREGVKVTSVTANALVEEDSTTVSLEFPFASRTGGCASGVCKCEILEKGKANIGLDKRIFIGDGRSDFCCANKADVLFAKNKLVKYCVENQIAHIEFVDFNQIQSALTKMFGENLNRFEEGGEGVRLGEQPAI